jgi:hypothetical protein
MEIRLNVADRLIIINTLPAETNYLTLKIIRDIKDNLGITEEEFTEFGLGQTETSVTWNAKGIEPKPFTLGKEANKIIISALKDLDLKGKLTEQHIHVYELFVEKED